MYDLLVIGAGASGLLAAALSAGEGLRTAVLERNNIPAKKIYATGNGHCNYLNAESEGFNESYRVLESIGISGVSDDEGRYYPRSREASSVAEALVFAAENSGAQIICDCHITDVVKTENGFKVVSKDGRKFESSKLLIATGGKAGIQFGCYGEGYRWAQYLGHSLVKPIPALVPVECEEDISVLHGVRVRGRVSLYQNGELMGEDSGEIQFTKDSVSGICVMDLSREVRLGEGKQYCLSVDLFPELSEKELLDLYMSREKLLGHGFKGLVPEKMKEYIDFRVSKEPAGADAYIRAAKDLRFTLKGTKGWADAQVTSGGIPLSEIDPKTMGSKIVEGLFFAGEIIDYDGPCGGYNLGNAWRTAIAAAKGIKATK
ncbi:MAG: aminoacetone oxidase family FAD-binding enzyme [Firmicutes bacterium]|nr:aminoacetone oxidase family FAD-binding enzyme [Bacillota bacterium]